MSSRYRQGVVVVTAALAALVLAGCASTQRGPTEWDGLVRQPNTRLDAVFLRPGVSISSYTTIMLAPADVQFAENWDPNRAGRSSARRLDTADILAIKANLSTMFGEIFTNELTSGGYKIVTEPGPDTLLVVPAIVNLFITAPDTASAGRTRTYTANSGQMTLVLEVRDSVTGEVLARVVDGRSGRTSGFMTVTNRVTNTADARRAMQIWAGALRNGLDSLRQPGSPSGGKTE
jgi:hypothetical protein